MKKLLFLPLLAFLFSFSNGFAYDYSSLVITPDDDSKYTIILDDHEQKGYGRIEFENLRGGEYYLKIIKHKRNNWGYGEEQEVIYRSYITIDESCDIYASIDKYDRFNIDKEICRNAKPKHKKKKYRHDDDNYYHKEKVSSREFHKIKKTIEDQWFDDTKVSVSKQVIRDYNISVEELVDILNLLSFESSKLELAKYAYDNMYNTRGFYQVYDVFSFSSSVEELSEYIDDHSRNKNSSDW